MSSDIASVTIDRLRRENEEQARVLAGVADREARLLGKIGELQHENAALRADKERLDFLSTLTGSGWACLHLDNKGAGDDWFLTRKQIDRRMATEPKAIYESHA